MKKHTRILMFSTVAFLIASILLAAARPAAPQKTNGVEIKDEPHHHLRFENEFVRVWETALPEGEATLWHRHNFDNLAVTIGDAKLRIEPLEGTPAESETKMGDVAFRSASYVHRALNIGQSAYINLLIELLKPPAGRPKPIQSKDENGRKPILENDRVRVYRLSLASGESIPMHSHPYPGLSATLGPAEIEVETANSKKVQRFKIDGAEVRWRPGAVTHSIRNVGTTRFEAVDIELK